MCDIGLGLAGRGLRTEASHIARTEASHIATTSALPEKEADIKKESRASGWKCHTPPEPASPENLGLSTGICSYICQ